MEMAKVSRRVIGKVNIFDIFGTLGDEWIEGIKSYMECYIKECAFKNVILNIRPIQNIATSKPHRLLAALSFPKKTAVYFGSQDLLDQFTKGYKENKLNACNSQKEIVSLFGRELVERDKIIQFTERREYTRIKTALDVELTFTDNQNAAIESTAIVTNISRCGIFVEYLDLKSAITIEDLDYFKNMRIQVKMKSPHAFHNSCHDHSGKILRIEFTGNQTGLAI
ncbi:MAG: hypothetical protein KKH94_12860, partial [Candidatus Omnitrophica bacterium]|nr:hypothetical protein [Candidatus Omnitrophota bacterium]